MTCHQECVIYFIWMNLSRPQQRSKGKISTKRSKLRAEEGNLCKTLLKLLLGQPCWSHLVLWDLHEWHGLSLLWAVSKTRSLSHGWGHWAVSLYLRGYYAAEGNIMACCKISSRLSKHWSHIITQQRRTLFYLKLCSFGTDRPGGQNDEYLTLIIHPQELLNFFWCLDSPLC